MFGRTNAGAERHMREGPARGIEQRAAKIPSDVFLWAAGASILGSLALQASKRREEANFVGQWAPTFLILGLYNKLTRGARED